MNLQPGRFQGQREEEFTEAGGATSPYGVQFGEEGGGQPDKPLKVPAKPTAEMVGMHEISHIPFRASCPHCVRGRGKSFQHGRVDHSQDDKDHPVVSTGYAFFGAPGELPADTVGGQKMPVLVVRDRFTKSLVSHLYSPCRGSRALLLPRGSFIYFGTSSFWATHSSLRSQNKTRPIWRSHIPYGTLCLLRTSNASWSHPPKEEMHMVCGMVKLTHLLVLHKA